MLSPSAPFRAEATVIGPVGFAETISTCTRSRGSAQPPPYSGSISAEQLAEEGVGHPEVQEPRPGDLGPLDLGQLERPRRELLGDLARRPAGSRAACSATFVA